jgi:hypothetical protein
MPEKLGKNPLPVFLRAAFFGCIIALATLAWLFSHDGSDHLAHDADTIVTQDTKNAAGLRA